MKNLNLEYLKKLNRFFNYKITGGIKLYDATSYFINEIDCNYPEIITVIKTSENKNLLNDFNFLLVKLKEHNKVLQSQLYLATAEVISNVEMNDYKELREKIKSRRRELFSILYHAHG